MEVAAELVEVPSMKCVANNHKSGQAMAEFLVGLVGIMFIILGLLQVKSLSTSSMDLFIELRGKLADAMVDPASTPSGYFVYASGNDMGPDKRAYTPDDQLMGSSADSFFPDFLAAVDYDGGTSGGTGLKRFLEEFGTRTPESDKYLKVEDTNDLAASFDMLLVSEDESVPILPYLSRLVGKSEIIFREKIWMPKSAGLRE